MIDVTFGGVRAQEPLVALREYMEALRLAGLHETEADDEG